VPIDPQEPWLQPHGWSATYAARRSEESVANGCRSPPGATRDASWGRAAALTTSRANRQRITPNRSTWRGWVRTVVVIAWENIERPSWLGASLRARDSLQVAGQVEARNVRRRGRRGAVRIRLCQVGVSCSRGVMHSSRRRRPGNYLRRPPLVAGRSRGDPASHGWHACQPRAVAEHLDEFARDAAAVDHLLLISSCRPNLGSAFGAAISSGVVRRA
jgi:hypothetical protein